MSSSDHFLRYRVDNKDLHLKKGPFLRYTVDNKDLHLEKGPFFKIHS
jgi:hypothetical protein